MLNTLVIGFIMSTPPQPVENTFQPPAELGPLLARRENIVAVSVTKSFTLKPAARRLCTITLL